MRSLAWFALVACDAPSAPVTKQLERATPDYGPLRGGSRIELAGRGFSTELSTRVLVGGREAPLVEVIDDTRLHVVIPPGEQPGDAELVVFDATGSAEARGLFHYSTPPEITGVSPRKVLVTRPATLITLSGAGFLDEAAGPVTVTYDGVVADDVIVKSDTELTFSVPAGAVLSEPTLELADDRGTATRSRAFRYVPSERDGLLLFPHFGNAFAVFFDPVDNSFVELPWTNGATTRFTAVVRDEHGEYWAVDRGGRFGYLDMRAQRIREPLFAQGLFPTVARAGTTFVGIERIDLRIVTIDLATTAFSHLGTTTVACCGSYGIASDGNATYFTSRDGLDIFITEIDPVTGETGAPVKLLGDPSFHVEEMRFFQGTLYATSRDSTLVTIDPETGIVTKLPISSGRFGAMEVLD